MTASFNLIFADPPFDEVRKQLIVSTIFERKLLKEDGVLILEHPREDDFKQHEYFKEHRNYNKVNFSIFGDA